MKSTIVLASVLLAIAADVAMPQAAQLYERPSASPTNPIDKIVFAKLMSLGLHPVLCSDSVFVRRAYLDIIGTLPTAQEAREFIQNTDARNKRRILIDKLLDRDEYADYWAMKWGDLFRIKAEFPVNLWPNAAQAYHRWVRESIQKNKPYDDFARELLTSSGSNFREGPVNFYRAVQSKTPDGLAATVALTLMGARIDAWPKEKQDGMAAFFTQVGYKPTREWKEEIVFWDPLRSSKPKPAPPADGSAPPPATEPVIAPPPMAMFPDGTKVQLTLDKDPREVFADWLITPKNPWFAKNIVNRTWSWFLGRGIIQEADDIRDDNPPVNPALLDYLQEEFVANHYDMKHLFRVILNSETYQFSSMPKYANAKGQAIAEANFAGYGVRRLEAEVLIDAINKITGTSDLYTSAIPEPFTYIPQDKTAIAIADGSITSSFLALFGRSPRATGMENERDNRVVPAHWLHLLNSSHIQRKLEDGPKLKAIIDSGRSRDEITRELYLTILSRFPTSSEARIVAEYGEAAPAGNVDAAAHRRNDWIDTAWALINSEEFLYRH